MAAKVPPARKSLIISAKLHQALKTHTSTKGMPLNEYVANVLRKSLPKELRDRS
jgi:predicted DNA binding CopG/RHH family protein